MQPLTNGDGKFYVVRDSLPKKKMLERCRFPYNIPEETKHFIMWYTYGPEGLAEEQINKDIYAALKVNINTRDYYLSLSLQNLIN